MPLVPYATTEIKKTRNTSWSSAHNLMTYEWTIWIESSVNSPFPLNTTQNVTLLCVRVSSWTLLTLLYRVPRWIPNIDRTLKRLQETIYSHYTSNALLWWKRPNQCTLLVTKTQAFYCLTFCLLSLGLVYPILKDLSGSISFALADVG